MIQKVTPIRRWKQWLVLPLSAVLFVVVVSEQTAAQGGPVPMPKPTTVLRKGTLPRQVRAGEVAVEHPSSSSVYVYVEKMPQLPGGGNTAAIVEYIQRHLVYPGVAPANRKEGRVFVSFTVAKEGEVKDINIVKGLSTEYDAAVVAAVQQLPRFIPGTQNNRAVNVSFTVPIKFTK